jgi:putrescine aminotransferase
MTVTPARSRRASVIDSYRKHVNHSTAMLAELNGAEVEARAEGAYVYDQDERRYLDCGGYGVMLLGHSHPGVRAAVKAQLDRQSYGTRFLLNEAVAEAAEAITRVAPEGLENTAILNSGADAVELALKLTRLGGKDRVVAMEGGFHGKTFGALTLTAEPGYRDPFAPLVPGIEHVPFGEIGPLAAALSDAPGRGCVVLEPVQGEAGVRIPPAGYLREVEELCRAGGHWLIVDEIQSGMGRTGRWWASGREGVEPDVLLAGKVLGGGVFPVGAVVASAEVWEPLGRDPFLHSATFGNMPLAAAAVSATIEAIETGEVLARARALGDALAAAVAGVVEGHLGEVVEEVRATGLLLGIECREPSMAADLIYELFQRGVIVNHSLTASETVRLTPSVCLSDGDIDWLCEALRESLRVVADNTVTERSGG